MINWKEKQIDSLIAATVNAGTSARYVLAAINLVAVILLTGTYNAYFPWIRNLAKRSYLSETEKSALEVFIRTDLQTVTAPLIGVRFSGYDLPVLGSVSMVILAYWFFFCVERERIAVLNTLEATKNIYDVDGERLSSVVLKARADYVYHSIAHYFIFTTGHDVVDSRATLVTPRAAYPLLMLMISPVVVPALAILSEVLSLFRKTSVTGRELNSENKGEILWDTLVTAQQSDEVIFRIVVSSLVVCATIYVTGRTKAADEATRASLKELKELSTGMDSHGNRIW